MQTTEIRDLLPPDQKQYFDDIVTQRVLGASKHISMIGDMFCAIAKHYESNGPAPVSKMKSDILKVARYFKETRGEASCAVNNAIEYMTGPLSDLESLAMQDAVAKVLGAVGQYSAEMDQNVQFITDCAVKMSENFTQIMVFDYSSTVNLFLQKLGKKTKDLTVYIPESRIINGGFAYVKTVLDAGLKAHYIPDAAIMFYLKQCDAVYFGAETYYADGTAFNTVGSDMVGLICHHCHIPLYVLTPLIKLDIRPVQGFVRQHVYNSMKEKVTGFPQDDLDKVSFSCPELLPVPANHIRAFITEEGVIPPGALYHVSMRYARKKLGMVYQAQAQAQAIG